MKSLKRMLSVVLCIIMMFSIIPLGSISAEAASTTPKVTINTGSDNYKIEKTNAVLCAELSNPKKSKVETVGIKLYDETGNLLKEHSEPGMYHTSQVSVWFDINAEVGYKLTEGKIYIYQFYAVVAGTTYKSAKTSFKTKGTGVSIDTSSEHYKVTKTNAVLCSQVSNTSEAKVAKVGIKLYDSSGKLLKDHSEPGQYNTSTVFVWFDVNSEVGYTLSAGTTYKYQMYAVVGGKTYTSLTGSFKTIGSASNIYNLGEETYSFENFTDSDATRGHCFGMSITSSGYYTKALEISDIGLNDSSELYTAKITSDAVKEPICHYQSIQGSIRDSAIVSGGRGFTKNYYNAGADWDDIVNYVKNHNYDNKGSLQVINYVESTRGGHAMNFLYYSKVNGQDRIYVYDNNFPTIETYFYKDSSGKIKQAPKSTFSKPVDTIGLLDVNKYLENAKFFDYTYVIYADADMISVEGATVYPMIGTDDGQVKYMYEIPETIDQVKIVPLVDNAEFSYFNKSYSFGQVSDTTVGTLVLGTLGAFEDGLSMGLTITDDAKEKSFFDKILDFFKSIIDFIMSIFS